MAVRQPGGRKTDRGECPAIPVAGGKRYPLAGTKTGKGIILSR